MRKPYKDHNLPFQTEYWLGDRWNHGGGFDTREEADARAESLRASYPDREVRVREQMPPRTPWQDVTLTDGRRDVPATSPLGVELLCEYRQTGSMQGYWPCTAAELDAYAATHVDLADAGTDADRIDFNTLPTPAQARRLRLGLAKRDMDVPLSAEELAAAMSE